MSSSSNEGNHNLADVLLYAESKLTRKQAIREIADVVLKANMRPKTVKYALDLLKILLPTDNTLPSTVDELFGAMLSSENDWRLAQYLMKYKQRPSFLSTPNTWNENSSSTNSLAAATAASSSSIPTPQELNSIVQSPSFFLPISSSSSSSSNSSSSSESESENESESESESDSSESESSEEDDDERNILFALHEAQQQRSINSPPIRLPTENPIIETNTNRVTNTNDTSDQRSQIVSSSLNRFPFLGSFKRQRSETSSDDSSSEPDLFFSTRLSDNNNDDDDDDDDSDNETPFYPISNNNNNNKSCCFEMNGCDLLDGGKRRRN